MLTTISRKKRNIPERKAKRFIAFYRIVLVNFDASGVPLRQALDQIAAFNVVI